MSTCVGADGGEVVESGTASVEMGTSENTPNVTTVKSLPIREPGIVGLALYRTRGVWAVYDQDPFTGGAWRASTCHLEEALPE
jgi:hypothetical protein